MIDKNVWERISFVFLFRLYIQYLVNYLMEDSQEITIVVLAPQQRQELAGVNKFQVYVITGKDSHGAIQNTRRYSDFTLLRDILIGRWPGCYIPSLPSKRTIGSNEAIFLQNRRRGLKYFLTVVSKNRALWNSQQMQIFLRNTNGTSEKEITLLSKEGKDKLLSRYQGLYAHHQSQNQNGKAKLLEFNTYLKEVKIILQKLQKQSEVMSQSFKKGIEKKYIFLEFLLPDYEKNCLLANDEKNKSENLLFLCSGTNGINQCLQKFKKVNEYMPIYYVSEQIKRERKQVESFVQILKSKQQYESLKLKTTSKVKDLQLQLSKIQNGKESLLSKIKKKSKEEQLQNNKQQLVKAQEEEALYTKLCSIINNLLIKDEIDRFKQTRKTAYYDLMRNFMKAESVLTELERDIWIQVGRHDWINIEQQNTLLKKEMSEEYKPKMQVIDEDQTNQLEQQEVKVIKKNSKSNEQEIIVDDL